MWIDLSQFSLYVSLLSIAFNPTAWNIVARNEYRNKTMTRFFGGNPYVGCYVLTFLIFTFGLLRDFLYHRALVSQPQYEILPFGLSKVAASILFVIGQILVLSSTYRLGITGTFLGDYFGILMDQRIEGFPFNILENPMYVGTTLSFVASALWYNRPAGLLISAYIYLAYQVALRFEGPFTSMIYSTRSEITNGSKLASKKEL